MNRTDVSTQTSVSGSTVLPRVTVVMPTYNGAQYLSEQLDSILSQEGVEISLVVIDDASKDGSWAVVSDYAARYPSIKAIHNPKNLGLIRTLKTLFHHIGGDYFALADQDDIWDIDKLIRSIRHMNASGVSLVYSDVRTIDGEGRLLQDRYLHHSKMTPYEGRDPIPFVFRNPAIGHTMVGTAALRDMLIAMPETILTQEHWVIACACAAQGVAFLDTPLGSYRQHGFNVVGARLSTGKRVCRALAKPGHFARRRLIRKTALNAIATLMPQYAKFAKNYAAERPKRFLSVLALSLNIFKQRRNIGVFSALVEISLLVVK